MGDESERKTSTYSRNTGSNPMEISIAEASSMFPGFRFSPTDEELIQFYLRKKIQGSHDEVDVIPEVDICRHEPWDLPAQSVIQSDNEWFFFSPRGKKYPNGSQSKRATESGYWKATGKERGVKSGSIQIGTKRTLVFHTGRAPKGQRTEWIMHEYTTSEKSEDGMVVCRLRKNRDFHLNDNLRRDYPGETDLLTIDNSTPPLSGVEQSGMLGGDKTAGSCSKDCTSSYNSHSVEQVDEGSESDEKLTNECSQSEPPSLEKEEEDCYADIMKDDIIKLDESSLIDNPRPLRVAVLKPKTEMKSGEATLSVLPSQGTANRRLRLRRQRMESYRREPLEIFKFETRNIPIEDAQDSQSQKKTKSLNSSPFTRIRGHFIFLFLVILILSILLLLIRNYTLGDGSKFGRQV